MAEALGEAMASAGPDYGKAVQKLRDSVADVNPIELMGAITTRYATVEAGKNPELDRREGMFWHHIELVQAFALGDGAEQTTRPLVEAVPAVREAVTDLDRAWIVLEAKKVDQTRESQRERALALMRLRTRAHAVRGWGYAERQRAMLEDLLRPLDSESDRRLGIRLSRLPGWWAAMNDAVNMRFDERRRRVQTSESWPVDEYWLARVRDELGTVPVLDESATLDGVRTSHDLRRWFLAASAETRIHEVSKFGLAEITALVPEKPSPETIRVILDRWSLGTGDHGVPLDMVALANPVIERPFISFGHDAWHLFCGWLPHHNPFGLIEAVLADDADLFEQYLGRRAVFLEERTAAVLRRALVGAVVESSVLSVNPGDGKEYENDVLALLDSHAVVAEAKAGRLGPEARRGKGRPLRDRIDDLLVRPSEQATRLGDTLASGAGTLTFTRKADATTFDVDLGQIHRALTVGVTLESIAGDLPRLAEIADAGLTTEAVDALAYSVSLPDLELVAEVLGHPSEFLHWLERRAEIERATWLTGDEMDLLGLYLDTGFNLGENEFKADVNLDVTGMSQPIDEWQYRQEAGMNAERPTVKRTDWWEACLARVERQQPTRWSEIGVAMCRVAPPEQRELRAAMEEFRDDVVAGRRPPSDLLLFHNGPEERRTLIVGIIAASRNADERRRQFEQAAHVALDRTGGEPAILISWSTLPIQASYLAIALAVT